MTELSRQQRSDAIASIQQYAEANLPEQLGGLAAGLLLDFFIEEIGPLLYNLGVADTQTRIQQRAEDIAGELHEQPFGYWPKQKAKRRK